MRSGIIGTGFMGGVHANAVRSARGVLRGVAADTPENAELGALRMGAQRGYATPADLIADPDIDVVHVCTPNHLHAGLALAALDAGKHVICEKPLATDIASAAALVERAHATGRVAAVPFAYRFYPTVRDARARVARGEVGPLRVLHGSYLQDWLAGTEDTDWRVDPALGGASRAFGDIGVHWCDLMEFTTGHRIVRLVSLLLTAHAQRAGSTATVGTEDVATVLFETDQGAIGSVVVSQITHGRKNRLWFSFDGAGASLSFDQELPDSLWIGGRDHSAMVARASAATAPEAKRYDRVPAGHPQGFQDCFNGFVSDVYAAAAGDCPPGLPTFDDGLRSAVITAAVLESARTGSWVDVTA